MQPLQVKVAILGMYVDNSLYGGIENQPSPAHASLNVLLLIFSS